VYRNVPISSIIIDRDNRQRRELKNIEELASSIRQIGLINAVVINDAMELIAGERRLEACRSLGWDTIPTQTREDLTAHQLQLLELEENIKRMELPWKDECRAVVNYHNLRLADNPEHTVALTAAELSMSSGAIYQRISIVAEMERGNELVLAADKFSVARNIVARADERRQAAEAENIVRVISGGEPAEPAGPDPIAEIIETSVPLINADFHEWAPSYDGPRFNFLHCDFPYGVNADKHHQGAAKFYRGYADSPDIYWTLVAALGDNMERLVADSAHMIFWYAMDFHTETRLALEQMGWRVNPYPLIWFKDDNTGILPDPARGPRRVYETAFLCARGDRKVVQPVANCFAAPVVKTIHMSQKSLPMLKHFMRMTVDEHTIMLDPTCGSGSAVRAALDMGAKTVLGLEKNPEFHAAAVEEWRSKEDGQIDLDL